MQRVAAAGSTSTRRRRIFLLCLFLVITLSCTAVLFSNVKKEFSPPTFRSTSEIPAPRRRMIEYKIVAKHPHDPKAFTEGLFFYNNKMYESTGRAGSSFIREFSNVSSGTVSREFPLPTPYFGEGISVVQDKLYMLTYKAKKGFILSLDDFTLQGNFDFKTSTNEGWGMTTNDQTNELIVSDGSDTIFIWQPKDGSMKLVRSIVVTENDKRIRRINELEFIHGQLWANVWFTNRLLRIDLVTGDVIQSINLNPLIPLVTSLTSLTGNDKYNAVMNGIAYNPSNHHVYVTGKLWNVLFELEFPTLF